MARGNWHGESTMCKNIREIYDSLNLVLWNTLCLDIYKSNDRIKLKHLVDNQPPYREHYGNVWFLKPTCILKNIVFICIKPMIGFNKIWS